MSGDVSEILSGEAALRWQSWHASCPVTCASPKSNATERRHTMSHALALVREEESLGTSVEPAASPVNATILVSYDAATKSLSFQSFNSQVIVDGTDITLQPG